MNKISKRKLVFVKVCSPFSFNRFTNAEKFAGTYPEAAFYWSAFFTSPRFTSLRFTSPRFTSPRFTTPRFTSPVQSSKYSMPPLSYPLFFSVNTVPVIPITIWVKKN